MMRRIVSVVLLVTVLFGQFAPLQASAQTSAESRARVLLSTLTPEERVGQLFLISFKGDTVTEDSQVYDLITRYHIGGVVFSAANDNFAAAPDTVSKAYAAISKLQEIEWMAAQDTESPSAYMPLFISMAQEGDGPPYDQIYSGLTPLPAQMAIGAAWDRELAYQVGKVMGSELASLGVNLYFGLLLDVPANPLATSATNDLGTRAFGGDPYWVGEMGRANLSGLHDGGGGNLAVVARHFPGRGEADRQVEDEAATVRKSLEQLKQIELAPFFAVTGNALQTTSAADGLMVSHIRYQGFQGNIRATTRPISFDPPALEQILNLPELASWRQGGGVLVSDDLGSQAVRRFYTPSGANFAGRLVARDAFLAGNDLLYTGNILSTGDPDNYTTIIGILNFFTDKYREDPAFAERVDQSVLRILTLKYRLYPTFSLSNVTPPIAELATLGRSSNVTFAVAQKAATLISPERSDLANVLPDPPNTNDYIVFITDSPTARQCSTCPDQTWLSSTALMNTVIRLYGPTGGRQINTTHLSSYTFTDLASLLDGTADMTTMQNDLRRARWVILAAQSLSSAREEATTLRRFLNERPDLLRTRYIILFSFGAPYYLDATDVSKLTAYYGLFSKSQPFVDVAARLLFQEITPAGTLPISVPGTGYDLIDATSPDPNQIISLQLDLPPAPTPDPSVTPEPTNVPIFREADVISVRTGIIVDHNQRQVPDGTVVRFTISQPEGSTLQTVEAVTVQGSAHASFRLDQPGLVEIRAASEPATTSIVLQLDVTGSGAAVTVIAPTAMPTETIQPPTPMPTSTMPVDAPAPFIEGDSVRLDGWMVSMAFLALLVGVTIYAGNRFHSLRWGLRWGLSVLLGGLAGYNYIALGFGNSEEQVALYGFPVVIQAILIGSLLAFAISWLWEQTSAPQGRDKPQDE